MLGRLFVYEDFKVENCLYFYRCEMELSQTELAIKCGLTQNTISSLETGVYLPNLITAIKISRVLNKPVDLIWSIVF